MQLLNIKLLIFRRYCKKTRSRTNFGFTQRVKGSTLVISSKFFGRRKPGHKIARQILIQVPNWSTSISQTLTWSSSSEYLKTYLKNFNVYQARFII